MPALRAQARARARTMPLIALTAASILLHAPGLSAADAANATDDGPPLFRDRVVVTNQAMGARCAVAADFDGDGRLDIVSASSNDNAVSWFRNEGPDAEAGHPATFSIKREITWSSLGSRIVTVADVDGDGDADVVGASYYDSALRWFENDGSGEFASHVISTAVREGQGVAVADLDNDGDPDVATASSGDNTIAVFKNMDRGVFCEIKEVVDDDAVGARTVVASDLDGDGWIDLASASKDDDSVAWYPNDGTGHFPTKHLISRGNESMGAYSLVAVDIDEDGDNDLVVASNGNDHVSLWRNDGDGNFTKTLIYDDADFVLSVTAVDFDRDGDIDVASASFFDGYIRWYENVDGLGYEWRNHTVYVGVQGHYVSHADMDGDGDDDLIAVTHAENTVAVFFAGTECDFADGADAEAGLATVEDCCKLGTRWNGTACVPCQGGTYGVGTGAVAVCAPCPGDGACTVEGRELVPETCSGITGCADAKSSVAECSCPVDSVKDPDTDACKVCPEGQARPDPGVSRGVGTIGNYTAWETQQGVCEVVHEPDSKPLIVALAVVAGLLVVALALFWREHAALKRADAAWTVREGEITYDDPVQELGKGAFGVVVKGYYRGTAVSIKNALPRTSEDVRNETPLELTEPNSEQPKASSMKRNRHLSLNASFAAVSKRSQLRKEFIREMRTLSKLRHPCIVTMMGVVRSSDNPRLLMEFMERGSLRDLLNNQTFTFDPELTLPLLRDILQGMRFLHSADPPIVHGDLKSGNVLIDGNFRAKIADFGLSARQKAGCRGTPFWMAPEVLRGGDVCMQSDVYAFGVTLWELMTHENPYNDLDMSITEILDLVCEGRLRPDCNHSGLDEELVDCMQDCWAQQADQRPTLQDLEIKIIPLCGQNLFSVMHERSKTSRNQSSLLKDIFPEHIAKDLLAGKKIEPQKHDCVTIYFSDIVGFTTISQSMKAEEVSAMLDRLYTVFDELANKHGVFKLETIGDAWVGVCNLTQDQHDHAARLARFSIDAVNAAKATVIHPERPEMGTIQIRVGFHSGPVVANVVGTKNPRYCLFGDTMNTASRMESSSEKLRIQCTEKAADLAREQDGRLKFTYRGEIAVKGKGNMRTYWLELLAAPTLSKGTCGSRTLRCSASPEFNN